MTDLRFQWRTRMPVGPGEVYDWHARPGALERLLPPWEHATVVDRGSGLEEGSRVVLRVHLGPLRLRWVARHQAPVIGSSFRDVQEAGPFARWEHDHRMTPAPDGTSVLEDDVRCAPPLGPIGRFFGRGLVTRKLTRMFRYRHATTRADLVAHTAYGDAAPLKIAVTGASGLIGQALVPFLTTGGHSVLKLVRRAGREPDEVSWDPSSGQIVAERLEGVDAVIHLAGESIASGRWSRARKERIRSSRTDGTRLLARTLASLDKPPAVMVSASAIGFYGERGGEALDETASGGRDFLAEVCRAWERAADPARDAGIRVVHPRIGVVLSPRGGALAKMLPPFLLGAGGRFGHGGQYMSWIGIDDVVGALLHALRTPALVGPVNLVAPRPVTNTEFATTLGKVLRRPTVFPVPAFAARALFGELAEALLLASTRVAPGRLSETGYVFRHVELEAALRHLLGREAGGLTHGEPESEASDPGTQAIPTPPQEPVAATERVESQEVV